jgi:hypothetical protein
VDKPHQRSNRVYVIVINGQGIVAFETVSFREASELRKEAWFRDELMSLRSKRIPVWDGKATLSARNANPEEISEFEIIKASAPSPGDDEILLGYLIPIDELD